MMLRPRLSSVLSRRELFRVGTVGGLVVVAPNVFAGCSDDSSSVPPKADAQQTIRLVSSDVARADADPAAIATGAASVVALGSGLYGRLVGTENVALSPFSAAVALGMTVNGAAASTRAEMLAVLGAADVTAVDDGLNALTAYVESLAGPIRGEDGEIALDSANRVFGQHDYPWRADFLDALARSYGAGVMEVDFAGDTETARAAVNAWTSEQTHDRIPEIVPDGAVDELTRMVLVNALYFKAPWAEPFETEATRAEPFHLASGEQVDVQMMHGGAGYGEGDGWRAAHLYYAGGTLAMTVVLPDEGREGDLDSLVSAGGIAGLLVQGAGHVPLSLPKWTFLSAAPLTEALQALGMTTAFGPDADFSGMTTEEQLHLQAVLQQVFIAVDEAGTEAAAATAVVAGATSAEVDPPAPLVVDRPFVFVIHDVEHGTPLFLGKVVDPR